MAGFATNGAGTVVAAFDSAGTALWSTVLSSNNALALAGGRSGEFYAVGDGGVMGYLVVKFDAAFNQVWRNIYPARGVASRAAVDLAGNVVVIGSVDTSTGPLTMLVNDWLTLKLDANGTLLWSATHGTPTWFGDVPYGLAIGPDNAIYVTGEGSTQVTDPMGNVYFSGILSTVKYAPGGAALWVATSPLADRGIGIKVSGDGGVLVLGDAPQTLLRYPQSGLPNQSPVAVATAGPSATGVAPLTVSFSAAGSLDPDGALVSYTWNFGDGQSSTEINPTHVYAVGTWTAQLTVTDSLGASASSAPLVINATAPGIDPAKPRSLTFAKSSVPEGTSTTATVTVSNRSGVTLAIASSDPNVATVPAKVVVPAGQISATFLVSTLQVRKDTRVTIRATANGVTVANTLTVRNR